MTLLNSCQVLKSLACIDLVANNSIDDQLNRFLALQDLVETQGDMSHRTKPHFCLNDPFPFKLA